MTKSDGRNKINAVEVGELTLNTIRSPTPVLAVTYAFTNAETGDRYGSGHRNVGWSDKTLEALAALIASVEADVCSDIFDGGTTSRGGSEQALDTSDGVPTL